VKRSTQQLKEHAKRIAAEAGRPYQYLASPTTKASGQSKEDLARAIGADDNLRCFIRPACAFKDDAADCACGRGRLDFGRDVLCPDGHGAWDGRLR